MSRIVDLLTKQELAKVKMKYLYKDEVLFREKDICKEIGVVIEGTIIIKSFNKDGKEIVFAKINNDEIFGHNLLFSKDKHYKGDVIALKDTKLMLIDKTHLLNILQNNKEFLIEYLSKEANNTKDLNTRIKVLTQGTIEDKLLYYLNSNKGEIEYTTITDLSKELNVQRETLSRTITKLTKKKVIKNEDHKIKRL